MAFCSVILAAGEGKRMKSRHSKVLHQVCGSALVDWVIDAAQEVGSAKNIVVVGHKADEVQQHLGDTVLYAVQSQQLGTGHAVQMAVDLLTEEDTLVTCGDMPLLSAKSLKEAYEMHKVSGNSITLFTAEVKNPYGYGRIIRDGKNVRRIVEEKDATDEEKKISEINSGTYFFKTKDLISALSKLKNNNAQGEYYLTDTLQILIEEGKTAGSYIAADPDEIMGVNDRVQLAQAAKIKQRHINEMHMRNGVTIADPDNTYIENNVKIGIDTYIGPNTFIMGGSVIDEDCVITGSRIDSSIIGKGTDILNSVIIQSKVGSSVHIGPFAYLRPNSNISDNVKIGDFVEVKNTAVGKGTKVSHLTYLGDADIGERVNFGCGTVIVNYDGKTKHRCVIGDDAFIGCNTNLVSPVTVEDGAFIAAGSTITDDIPAKAFAIARSRQTVKTNWRRDKE